MLRGSDARRLLAITLRLDRTVADVAELADALASGASGGNPVEVRVLSSASSDVTAGWCTANVDSVGCKRTAPQSR